jgi:FAD/FMN-containing dehydrogenase
MRDADFSRFADEFDGVVSRPGDDGYQELLEQAVWNGDGRRRAAAIARATTSEQVAAAIRFARDQGIEVTVRGGGHSFAGYSAADGALLIDLSGMNSVLVDPATRTATVGGGATWAMVDAATAPHGLACPGGTISHTGVGGLTLGGGIGWLNRQAGLTCDRLIGAEVVTADGRVVNASDEENADLMWALRGGGGNFGVVTSFRFSLVELAPMANIGLFFWPPDRAGAALRFARDHVHALPTSYGAMVAGLNAPPAPFVPAEHQGAPGYAVIVANWGSDQDHAAAVKPFFDLSPLFTFVSPIPHVALQGMLDEAAPWGIYAYEKAHVMSALSDEVIDLGVEHLTRRASPMSITPIFPVGGAYAENDDERTSYGGDRDATRWVYNISAVAPTPELLEADKVWTRSLADALSPYALTGSYVNFLTDATEDKVRATYGPKYARLASIKAQWDPENVFRHNANIRPGTH